MNLRDLEYLIAVADHRHFGKAAEASYVSQPTLSTQIKKLELELGVELVERSPRQIALTEVGERIVERARVVLREADNIRDIARHSQSAETGSIRIGLFPTLGPYLLPHVVPNLKERFPNLELLLTEEKTETVLAGLRDGKLDVGILAMPIDDPSLHVEPLFVEDFVLAVPRSHPLALENVTEISLSDLAGEILLLLEDGHCLRDQALSVCQMVGAGERSGFRATSLETLRQMVVADVGVTLLPELSVQPPVPTQQGIHLVRFTEPVPNRAIAMFWRKSSAFRDFLPDLAEVFRELPHGLVRPIGRVPQDA